VKVKVVEVVVEDVVVVPAVKTQERGPVGPALFDRPGGA
jgi:hypothetical protein